MWKSRISWRCLFFLIALNAAFECQAQQIHEVLCAVQERKLAVVQRRSVTADLKRQAEVLNSGVATSAADPVENNELIDWGAGFARFPTSNEVEVASIPRLLEVLNKAAREAALLRRDYLNTNGRNDDLLLALGQDPNSINLQWQTMGLVPACGEFTEQNWRSQLTHLASIVEGMRTLQWPYLAIQNNSRSFANIYHNELPEVLPTIKPEHPFIDVAGTNAYAEWGTWAGLATANGPAGFRWEAWGAGMSVFDTSVDVEALTSGVVGVKSHILPEAGPTSGQRLIEEGKISMYKKMLMSSVVTGFYDELLTDSDKLPCGYWKEVFSAQGVLEKGVSEIPSGSSDESAVHTLYNDLRILWDLPSFSWDGQWNFINNAWEDKWYYYFDPRGAGYTVESSTVCFPNFTVIGGRSKRQLMGDPVGVAGEVQVPVTGELVHINLQRGLYDRQQTASLDFRLDGFGNPIFRGQLNAFKVLYDRNESNFPDCLVEEKFYYNTQFTSQETAKHGWDSKSRYVAQWYMPRLRQIYGTDVVVDIIHETDYRKILKFYWAKDVTVPTNELPVAINGTPFKIVVVENPTAGIGSFPDSNKKLRINDAGVYIDIEKTGVFGRNDPGNIYTVKMGSSSGGTELRTREVEIVSETVARETVEEGAVTTTIETEYYRWLDANNQPKRTFGRFTEFPVPVRFQQGSRIMHLAYTPAVPQQNELGLLQYEITNRPRLSSVTCTGDSAWTQNGAVYQWEAGPVLTSSKRLVHGVWHETTISWNGRTRTTVDKLGGASWRTQSTNYSADLLTVTELVDSAPATQYLYTGPAADAPGTLTKIVRPGGHSSTWSIVPGASTTTVEYQEGWGENFDSGIYQFTTFNSRGGLVSSEKRYRASAASVLLSVVTGSQHTGWGEPARINGMLGEQLDVTYHTSGSAWGLPSAWTASNGETGAVSGYDGLRRPTGLSDGVVNYVPDYSNPLQKKIQVTGLGEVTTTFSPFGEVTSFLDTQPGGLEMSLAPGSAFVKSDGRQATLNVSSSREVLGRTGGMGSRGASESWTVEGGQLCRVTVALNDANGAHYDVKTYFDGNGRVVKVKRPGHNGQDVTERWEYDDANRTVHYYPVAGPSSKEVIQTLSADGSTVTTTEVNGVTTEISRGVTPQGWLSVTHRMLDDSTGAATWQQISRQEYHPSSGVSRSIPWNLDEATTTTTVPSSAPSMTITQSGPDNETSNVVLSQGKPTRIHGQSAGVAFNLDQWTYQHNRLKEISGSVGGKDFGIRSDLQGRLTRQWGPGFDRNYSYQGTSGFEVRVTDSIQNIEQVVKHSALGDLTELSGDVGQALSASTQDLVGGGRSTTVNDHVTLKRGADGTLVQKDYSGGLVENRNYEADGTPKTFGTGPEAAMVVPGGGDTFTTSFQGGGAVTEEFYKVGLRSRATGPVEERRFKYLRGALAEEKHDAGPWAGWVLTRTQDDKGRRYRSEVSIQGENGGGSTSQSMFERTYDNQGRVKTAGGATYHYDAQGRIHQCVRPPLVTTWIYDNLGRVEDVHTDNSSGPDINFHHGYNPRNLRVTRTATGGQSWTGMTYDGNGRLTGATLTNGAVLSYGYDGQGNRVSGGAPITYTINGLDQVRGRLLGERAYGVSGSVAPGARVKVFHPLAPEGEEISVDPATGAYHHLWPVDATWGGGGVTRVEMLVRGTLEGAATLGADAVADKQVWTVVPAVAEILDYDGAGRLVGDSEWVYVWNGMGHLTCMVRKAGTSREPDLVSEGLSFQYDADGRRLEKVRTRSYANSAVKVEASRMFWDEWLPVIEQRWVDGTPLPRRTFHWGRDVSGTWDGAGGIGGLVAIEEEGGRRLLVVDDGLGNITALINQANGDTVAKFDYAPFGELVASSGDVNACPFRYQGKYYDAETGLSYFGFRYYSAKLGRWISRDPLGEEGGFNLYGYCGNDPVNRWDYLGMDYVLNDLLPVGGVGLFNKDSGAVWTSVEEVQAYTNFDGFLNDFFGRNPTPSPGQVVQLNKLFDYAGVDKGVLNSRLNPRPIQASVGTSLEPVSLEGGPIERLAESSIGAPRPWNLARSKELERQLAIAEIQQRAEATFHLKFGGLYLGATPAVGRVTAEFNATLYSLLLPLPGGRTRIPKLSGAPSASRTGFDWVTAIKKGARPHPATYMAVSERNAHLALFEGGAVRIGPTAPAGTIGRTETWVFPRTLVDDLIRQAKGDVAKLEQLLGFDAGYLGKSPVLVEIPRPLSVRLPTGNEFGANPWWRAGGYTSGGIPEAIIAPVPPGQYTVRPVF